MPIKTLFLIIAVAWLPDWNTISRSGEIRRFKEQASEAFRKGKYDEALVFYRHLYDKLNIGEEEVMVNLAHCYFMQRNNKQATALYQIACRSPKPAVRSLAWQQLGVLAYRTRRYDWAGMCFKNALKSNPANDDARYNYELVRKMASQNRSKPTEPPPPPTEPPPPPEPDARDSTRTDNEPSPEQYGEMNLSEERAEMLLEAMKDTEKQYIRQQKKKSGKKPPPESPDW